ncbi:MAG: hypothetical protein WBW94_08160 [Anaerolineales bacterium]
MAESILFICGSLNQTTMMHKIAKQLGEYNCFFTPYYTDGMEDFAARIGLLNFCVLGGRHMQETKTYLADNNLAVDYRGKNHKYDLVVTCSDLIVPNNIRRNRLVLVQEGITEPEGFVYQLVKRFKLPRYWANTAATGLSDAYDIFCVASHGYREHFIKKGVRPEKIAVSGIPNFDHLSSSHKNDFPFGDYVLVATSPLRETFRRDDRMDFLHRCIQIANGKPLIFKLHPTENPKRATQEIHRLVPEAQVLTHGNINPMIANASVVITQQSTCTFVAIALGKEVYTNLNINELKHLMPIQNGGLSAQRIAEISRRLLHTPMPVLEQIRRGYRARPKWEQADLF